MIRMPLIGLGTWPLSGAACRDAVRAALDMGYAHVDTAQMYGNEDDVGAALKASGVPRDEVFLTTKVHQDRMSAGTALASARESTDRLGVEAVDLMLIHWPPRDMATEAVIDALEEIRTAGLARAIGVSNFNRPQLRAGAARAPILTNQVEFHALIDQSRLLDQARALGISLTAYQPVARGQVMAQPEVQEIAARIGATPAQVALRWILQQGVSVIPMSTRPRNLADNLGALDISLSQEDMGILSALARRRNHRFTDIAGWSPDWNAD